MRPLKQTDVDVVILCGGKGTRLSEVVRDRPKPMSEINGRSFLDILIGYVSGFGFKRFILSVGYKADYIKDYYKNNRFSFEILFSRENEPLGTAGGVKQAENLVQSNPFLVMNGDSFCPVDLLQFLDFHSKRVHWYQWLLLNQKMRGILEQSVWMIRKGSFDLKRKKEEENLLSMQVFIFSKRSFLSHTISCQIFPGARSFPYAC